jgi:pentatricopeptide repeat protein
MLRTTCTRTLCYTRQAFRFYNHKSFENVVPSFNKRINVLAKQHKEQEVLETFERMIEQQIKPNEDTFTSILVMYSKMKNLDQVKRWINDMNIKYNIQPNNKHNNILLDAMCRYGRVLDARRFFDSLPKDNFSYFAIITAYMVSMHKRNQNFYVSKIREVFDEMIRNNVQPTDKILHNVITAYCKVKDVQVATEMYNKMKHEYVIPSSVVLDNAILKLYIDTKQWDTACRFFDEINKNKISYSIMIQALMKNGEIEQGETMFQEMLLDNTEPDIITFTSMIDGYLRAKLPEKAHMLINEMKTSFNIEPGIAVWNSFLAHEFEISFEKGMERFQQMKEKDVISYTVMIRSLIMNGQDDQAKSYFDTMIRNGIQPDAQLLNDMIVSYIKRGDLVKALRVTREMKRDYNIVPVTGVHNRLLTSLIEKSMLAEAQFEFYDMRKNQASFDIMIKLLTDQGNPEKAQALAKQMQKKQVNENTI